jgi:hypothetical protein
MPTFDYINKNFNSHNTKLQYTKVAALLSVAQQLTPKKQTVIQYKRCKVHVYKTAYIYIYNNVEIAKKVQ